MFNKFSKYCFFSPRILCLIYSLLGWNGKDDKINDETKTERKKLKEIIIQYTQLCIRLACLVALAILIQVNARRLP